MSFENKSNVLKRKLSLINDNNYDNRFDLNCGPIKECLNQLLDNVVIYCMQTGLKQNTSPLISHNSDNCLKDQNFDLNGLELSADFWDDFDFDLKHEMQTIDENNVKTEALKAVANHSLNKILSQNIIEDGDEVRAQSVSNTVSKRDLDLVNRMQFSSNIPINGTKIGEQLLAELDFIKFVSFPLLLLLS